MDLIIGHYEASDEENERVLDRVRRNDPTLKELTLYVSRRKLQMILQAFDAIATNSSLKILTFGSYDDFLYDDKVSHPLTRALSLNMSLNDIRIKTPTQRVRACLDIIRASSHLEALTIGLFRGMRGGARFPGFGPVGPSIIDDFMPAMVQGLRVHMNLHSLTLDGCFYIRDDESTAFAAAFQANQTIKTLIVRNHPSILATSARSFVEALPHDNSLETIIFDGKYFGDIPVLSIVRTLCGKHIKNFSLLNNAISQDGYEKIVQILKENEHSFIKLDFFQDSQDASWQKKIRVEIGMLTWNNHLQVEKDTWAKRFLEQDAPSKKLIFLALERAKNMDNEPFSKAPNMLFHLIKQLPDLIVQAICDGHEMSSATMSPPTLMTTKRNSSASQDCLQLYESVARLADGDEEAKHLLSSKLKEAEIDIHRMITNKRMKKDGGMEANSVSCLPESDKSQS